VIAGPVPVQAAFVTVVAATHFAFEHPWPVVHFVPHVPQLLLSTFGSTQLLPHAIVGAKQLVVHCPPLHTCVPLHLIPQPPQLFGSVDVGRHVPLQ
jgi:hypothetical protein